MPIGLSDTDDKAAWLRSLLYLWWGREFASVDERNFWNAYLIQHGSENTISAIYDHANAAALKAKRGW